MRKSVVLAALAAAFTVSPAAAMSPGQANCPAQLAPRGLGAQLVEAMMNYKEGQEADPAVTNAIKLVNDACVKREKIPDAQQDAYARYVIARVSFDELTRQLGGFKVPVAVIDRVFDLGPGKANPNPDEVTEAQFNALVEEMTKAGVSIEKLPEHALGMMGTYVTVASELYRDQAAIR